MGLSFDLIVFAPNHVPKQKAEFASWFGRVRGTPDDFCHPSMENCVQELKEYYSELKSYLPWQEEEPDSTCAADYSFARYMIHCSFPLSCQRKAYDTALALCWRLQLGLYDISGSGDVIYPEAAWEAIEARSTSKKPWWKFWRP